MRRQRGALSIFGLTTLLTQGFIAQEKKEKELQGLIAVEIEQRDLRTKESRTYKSFSGEQTNVLLQVTNTTLLYGVVFWSAEKGIRREHMMLEGEEKKIIRDQRYDGPFIQEDIEEYNRTQGYTSDVWAPREMYGEWMLGGGNFKEGNTMIRYELTTADGKKIRLEQRVQKIKTPRKRFYALLEN